MVSWTGRHIELMRLALLVWMVFTSACGDRKSSAAQPNRTEVAATPSQSAPADLPGWYLGIADSSPDWDVWFLRLNADRSGALFDTRWVTVCRWAVNAEGSFAFRSAEEYGRAYVYEGVAGETIRGVLNRQSKSRPKAYGTVTFRRVDSDRTPAVLGARGGVYSSANYNSQAGDMTGAELVLSSVEGQVMLSLRLIEDAFGPFLARDVRRSNDTVRFRFDARWGPGWRAVFRDSAVSLWDQAAAPMPNGAPNYLLPRAGDLNAFFSQEAEGTCSVKQGR